MHFKHTLFCYRYYREAIKLKYNLGPNKNPIPITYNIEAFSLPSYVTILHQTQVNILIAVLDLSVKNYKYYPLLSKKRIMRSMQIVYSL